ncbi:head GIN domain-containing protein [Flavobacterium psychrophilum]|uniref:head GIN domain-containing protein n=1 Tax=Flavobacterium psychrophilum TaxID=96345 RepID=UPI000B7C3036|nr:head GIN domain-containing protein [Flavobacterium psychrophilum]MCB6060788.1 DUF2807 domain-containing protein [Flavobacterium psychrophilum]SNA70371.1 conserved hypothetical protein [Flavobacterium psychrophilum]SNB07693.1 conserved hypothetical protein [Flavobacterium psychrophilum]
MKKLFIIPFLVVTNLITAQVTKNVGNFIKVTAFDKISVQLIQSTENKIELKGKFENEAILINNNGELKIRLPLGNFLNGDDLVAKVYFTKLEGLEANEGSYVSCDTEIKALDFSLIAKEGSQIKAIVNAQRISIKSSNGSIIKLSGNAQNLDAVTNSGGKLEAEKCLTSQAKISVNAGGFADIYATDLVDAKTRAGGSITIYGNPKQVNQKIILGGHIIISKR